MIAIITDRPPVPTLPRHQDPSSAVVRMKNSFCPPKHWQAKSSPPSDGSMKNVSTSSGGCRPISSRMWSAWAFRAARQFLSGEIPAHPAHAFCPGFFAVSGVPQQKRQTAYRVKNLLMSTGHQEGADICLEPYEITGRNPSFWGEKRR